MVKRREEAKKLAKKDESTIGLGWYAGKVDGDNLLFFLFVSNMLVWSFFFIFFGTIMLVVLG